MTLSGGVAMLGLVMGFADAPASSMALAIDITALMPMSDTELRAMVGETTALWKPHGVVLTWITSGATSDPLPHGVVRVANGAASRTATALPLGAVVFAEGSATPAHTLMLSVAAVIQTVKNVKWQNRALAELPANSRDHLIGRALGRVLAHELGHYLLGLRVHAKSGLMRPEFRADQLIALSRQGFKLLEKQLPALRLRLVQLAAEQQHARAVLTDPGSEGARRR